MSQRLYACHCRLYCSWHVHAVLYPSWQEHFVVLWTDAMNWDILLVTVPTAAVVVVAVVHVEVVTRQTCVATTAMRLDTSHATVLLWHSRRSDDTAWCRLVITNASSGHRCSECWEHASQSGPARPNKSVDWSLRIVCCICCVYYYYSVFLASYSRLPGCKLNTTYV